MTLDCAFARVVRGEHKLNVTVEVLHEPSQIGHATAQVLFRIPHIGHAKSLGGGRYQLHQPLRILGRQRSWVECGFRLDHGEHEVGVQAILRRKLARQRGDPPFGGVRCDLQRRTARSTTAFTPDTGAH
jgi:hypothetical protein